MEQLPIRLAGRADVEAYADHVTRHAVESGRDGMPHFALARTTDRQRVIAGALEGWDRSLREVLWGRTFLLLDTTTGEIVGHVELRGGRVLAEMHRATLGMGIERAYTRQGHGRRLISTATEWARDRVGLSWIDLGVFENNEFARKLYQRMGFVEAGVRPDAFRLDAGVVVADVSMALRLN